MAIWTVHCTLGNLDCSLYTFQFGLYTVHLAIWTVHCTLGNLDCTLYTFQFGLYTVHLAIWTVHCTLFNLDCTLYTWQFGLYTVHFLIWTVHCTVFTVRCTVSSNTCSLAEGMGGSSGGIYSILLTAASRAFRDQVHWALANIQCTVYSSVCTVYCVHCTFYSVSVQCTVLTVCSVTEIFHLHWRLQLDWPLSQKGYHYLKANYINSNTKVGKTKTQ